MRHPFYISDQSRVGYQPAINIGPNNNFYERHSSSASSSLSSSCQYGMTMPERSSVDSPIDSTNMKPGSKYFFIRILFELFYSFISKIVLE